MIKFNYSETTSNLYNIQYTSNVHIYNIKLFTQFNISTLLIIMFPVYELWVTHMAPFHASSLTNLLRSFLLIFALNRLKEVSLPSFLLNFNQKNDPKNLRECFRMKQFLSFGHESPSSSGCSSRVMERRVPAYCGAYSWF